MTNDKKVPTPSTPVVDSTPLPVASAAAPGGVAPKNVHTPVNPAVTVPIKKKAAKTAS